MKNKIFSIIALLLTVTMFAGCSFTSLMTPVPTDTPASEIPSAPVSAEPAPVTETQQPAPETQTAPIAEITSAPVSETVTGTPVPEPTAEPKTETPMPEPTPAPAPEPTSKPTPAPTPAPTPKPEETPHTDIGYWVQYAENYAVSKEFELNDWVLDTPNGNTGHISLVLSTGHMLKGKAERKIKKLIDQVRTDANAGYNWYYVRVWYRNLEPSQVHLDDMDPSYSYYKLFLELAKAGSAPTEPPPIDMDYWVQYAKDYAESIGLELHDDAVSCYDDPISAYATHEQRVKEDIESCLNDYKRTGKIISVWVWYVYKGPADFDGLTFDYYKLYIGYATC